MCYMFITMQFAIAIITLPSVFNHSWPMGPWVNLVAPLAFLKRKPTKWSANTVVFLPLLLLRSIVGVGAQAGGDGVKQTRCGSVPADIQKTRVRAAAAAT